MSFLKCINYEEAKYVFLVLWQSLEEIFFCNFLWPCLLWKKKKLVTWDSKHKIFSLRLDYGRSLHAYVNQRLQIQLELLMMSGMPLETCWAVNELWNNKFYYKVASCWLFLLGRSIIMTFLFDWIYLLFIGFAFIISSLVIIYSDEYIFGDLNNVRFILLVLMFVVFIMFLIVSPNVISNLLGTIQGIFPPVGSVFW